MAAIENNLGKQAEQDHVIEILRDDCPENPREWDNGCVMLCEHRRASLGDEQATEKIANIIRRHPKYDAATDEEFNDDLETPNDKYVDISSPDGMTAMLDLLEIPWLPVYLYGHGGMTINTTGFSCRWDSGQAGIIVIDPFEYGGSDPEDFLRGNVETYDQFLTGDVYSVRIFKKCPCCGVVGEEVVACHGFYGDDFENNGVRDFVCDEEGETEAAFRAAVAGANRITRNV